MAVAFFAGPFFFDLFKNILAFLGSIFLVMLLNCFFEAGVSVQIYAGKFFSK